MAVYYSLLPGYRCYLTHVSQYSTERRINSKIIINLLNLLCFRIPQAHLFIIISDNKNIPFCISIRFKNHICFNFLCLHRITASTRPCRGRSPGSIPGRVAISKQFQPVGSSFAHDVGNRRTSSIDKLQLCHYLGRYFRHIPYGD